MRQFVLFGAASLCLAAMATSLRADDLIWASDITDPAVRDAGFVDSLVSAGHTVTAASTPRPHLGRPTSTS